MVLVPRSSSSQWRGSALSRGRGRGRGRRAGKTGRQDWQFVVRSNANARARREGTLVTGPAQHNSAAAPQQRQRQRWQCSRYRQSLRPRWARRCGGGEEKSARTREGSGGKGFQKFKEEGWPWAWAALLGTHFRLDPSHVTSLLHLPATLPRTSCPVHFACSQCATILHSGSVLPRYYCTQFSLACAETADG